MAVEPVESGRSTSAPARKRPKRSGSRVDPIQGPLRSQRRTRSHLNWPASRATRLDGEPPIVIATQPVWPYIFSYLGPRRWPAPPPPSCDLHRQARRPVHWWLRRAGVRGDPSRRPRILPSRQSRARRTATASAPLYGVCRLPDDHVVPPSAGVASQSRGVTVERTAGITSAPSSVTFSILFIDRSPRTQDDYAQFRRAQQGIPAARCNPAYIHSVPSTAGNRVAASDVLVCAGSQAR